MTAAAGGESEWVVWAAVRVGGGSHTVSPTGLGRPAWPTSALQRPVTNYGGQKASSDVTDCSETETVSLPSCALGYMVSEVSVCFYLSLFFP